MAICFNLAIGLPVILLHHVVLASRNLDPAHTRHIGIDHKPQKILNVVEGQNTAIDTFPQALVIGVAVLDRSPQLVHVLWVGDSDLEVRAFLVPLEAIHVLPEHHLDGGDRRFVLCKLGLKVCFVAIDVRALEVDRRCDIEIVQEVRDVY